jgi:hypothetical protein
VDPLFSFYHTDHCVGFLVKLDRVLSVIGLDEDLHPPPVSPCVHHKEIPNCVLDPDGRRYCLHHLDGSEFNIRMCSCESILDQRRRTVYQPVRYVVVSLCYRRLPCKS